MHCVGKLSIAFEHQSRVNGMTNPIGGMCNPMINSRLSSLRTRISSRNDANQCPSSFHFSHQWATTVTLFLLINYQTIYFEVTSKSSFNHLFKTFRTVFKNIYLTTVFSTSVVASTNHFIVYHNINSFISVPTLTFPIVN